MVITNIGWIWLILAALLIGFSKTGINGTLNPVIAILASTFGGKESAGLLLQMLIVGDIFAVFYYHHHPDKVKIISFLPWTIIGLVIGALVGIFIRNSQFN